MIFLTQQQLGERYGDPSISLNTRFNADASTSHKNTAYQYEFGYLKGRCIYAIIQKSQGNSIALVEAASLMAINGPSPWKLISALDPEKDSQVLQDTLNNPVSKLGYSYAPDVHDAFYSSSLFASHQLNRQQLVIYHPLWQVDLGQVESDPLT